MNNTIQYIQPIEKAKYLNALKNKADNDLLLYWHRETIKEDILDFIFNSLPEKKEDIC